LAGSRQLVVEVYELTRMFPIALRLQFCEVDAYQKLEDQRAKIGRLLNGFINSVDKKITSGEIT